MSTTPEIATSQLEARLAESIGSQSPVLAKTLSFFPRMADRFIKVQNLANLLISLDHKKKLCFSYPIPGKGSQDTLAPFPELKQVLSSIAVVSWIRGENEQGCNGWEADKLKDLLEVYTYQGKTDDLAVEKKALEILQITPQEVDLMRRFIALDEQADEIRPKKEDFTPETDALFAQAAQLRDQAYALIQANWPKKE